MKFRPCLIDSLEPVCLLNRFFGWFDRPGLNLSQKSVPGLRLDHGLNWKFWSFEPVKLLQIHGTVLIKKNCWNRTTTTFYLDLTKKLLYLRSDSNDSQEPNADLISLTSSYEAYYEDLNTQFRLDNTLHSKYRQRTFKMLTSYDKNEFMYQYLDDEADDELVDSLKNNSLKAVKVFQKAYYQEAVKGDNIPLPSWRMKEKMKTVNAALIMCLNIGVDPPDIAKAGQSSKLECWINQMTTNPQKVKLSEKLRKS